MAAASSFTWTGKKLTIAELITCFCTTPLPLVVKVTQVPSDYEKSCPKLSIGTVLFISGSGVEQRVALKTSDRNPKFISIPLEAKLKFEVVYTHDRGPPTFLENLLRGKVQSDLKVEISGSNGNRLSSTPDQEHGFPYGTFQVVGTYKETVLHAQTFLSASGELNPLRRNISVNCPVSLDIATGIYGKSADEFQKLKNRLKQSQSTKTTNQADPSHNLVLLANPPKSFQDFSQLRHSCHLHGNVQADTTASTPEDANEKSATILGHALQQLRQSSKQETIPLVDKTSSRRSMLGKSNSQGRTTTNTVSNDVTYDDGMSNLGKSWIKPNDSKPNNLTIDAPKREPSTYENESEKQFPNSKTTPGAYLNEGELGSPGVRETVTSANKVSVSKLQSSTMHLPVLDEYENEAKPDPTRQGKQATETNAVKSPQPSNSHHSGSLTSKVYENEAQLAYEEIPVNIHQSNNVTSGKRGTPLPPLPTEEKNHHKTSKKSSLGRIKDGGKRQSAAIPETDSWDEGDYVEPENEPQWRRSSTDIPSKDNRKWKTLSDVPKNVKDFSISDVSLCLELLKLQEYVDKFRERNVDGQFLLKLTKSNLMESFRMQELEAKQLFEFAVKKWRPKK